VTAIGDINIRAIVSLGDFLAIPWSRWGSPMAIWPPPSSDHRCGDQIVAHEEEQGA